MADTVAEIEEGGLKRTLKDLFAGATGGIAQVLLGELIDSHWREKSALAVSIMIHATL